jgi:hypothetical protein
MVLGPEGAAVSTVTTPVSVPTLPAASVAVTVMVCGPSEPGSTVTVTYPDGSTASVVAGPDGTWTVPNPGLNDGDTVGRSLALKEQLYQLSQHPYLYLRYLLHLLQSR